MHWANHAGNPGGRAAPKRTGWQAYAVVGEWPHQAGPIRRAGKGIVRAVLFVALVPVVALLAIAPLGCSGSAAVPSGRGGDSGRDAGEPSTGSGGATGSGGGTGGGTGGGIAASGGAGSSGGQSGGMPGSGGMVASGGIPGAAGATESGGMAGGGGMVGSSPAAALDGLRLDDVCGQPTPLVCIHEGKTSDDGTSFMKATPGVTMGGTAGTTYAVKLHFRGVVEPTHVQGGTRGVAESFVIGGTRFADGTNEGNFQQWRLTTTVPNQQYYLNAFPTGLVHEVRVIDFTETIAIGAGSTVTIDVYDANAHEYANTADPPLTPPGVAGSMMGGQFVQINVDGVM
jgi:hypothetical protein